VKSVIVERNRTGIVNRDWLGSLGTEKMFVQDYKISVK
jgi:hypothetical protein